jgi:hypothetical protein
VIYSFLHIPRWLTILDDSVARGQASVQSSLWRSCRRLFCALSCRVASSWELCSRSLPLPRICIFSSLNLGVLFHALPFFPILLVQDLYKSCNYCVTISVITLALSPIPISPPPPSRHPPTSLPYSTHYYIAIASSSLRLALLPSFTWSVHLTILAARQRSLLTSIRLWPTTTPRSRRILFTPSHLSSLVGLIGFSTAWFTFSSHLASHRIQLSLISDALSVHALEDATISAVL